MYIPDVRATHGADGTMTTLPRELLSYIAQFCDVKTLSTLLDDALLLPWLKRPGITHEMTSVPSQRTVTFGHYIHLIEDAQYHRAALMTSLKGYPVYEMSLPTVTEKATLTDLMILPGVLSARRTSRWILTLGNVKAGNLRQIIFSSVIKSLIQQGLILKLRFPSVFHLDEANANAVLLFHLNLDSGTSPNFVALDFPKLISMAPMLGSFQADRTSLTCFDYKINARRLKRLVMTMSPLFRTPNKVNDILKHLDAPKLQTLTLKPENSTIRVGIPLMVDLADILAQFPGLNELAIQGRTFEVVSMFHIGHHPLENLRLDSCSVRYLESSPLFSNVKHMALKNLDNLVSLNFLEHANQLKDLVINGCNDLREISNVTFPSLRSVSVYLTRPDGPLMFRNINFPAVVSFDVVAKALKVEVINIRAPLLQLTTEDFNISRDQISNIETWISAKFDFDHTDMSEISAPTTSSGFPPLIAPGVTY
jgi:hypothetical protein